MNFLSLLKKYEREFDYADIRVEDGSSEIIKLENKNISLMNNLDYCYGIRVLYRGAWGLSYDNDVNNAETAIKRALSIAKASSSKLKKSLRITPPPAVKSSNKLSYKINPFTVDTREKIDYLKYFRESLIDEDRIKNVTGILASSSGVKRFINLSSDVSQEMVFNVVRLSATAREGELIQDCAKRFCKLGGYEVIKDYNIDDAVKSIKEGVIELLHSKTPKPGRLRVICDPEMSGLFFHEAVGHACEADHVISNASIFKGRLGSKIAGEEVNLIDDPTMNARGFYWFDDEGVKASPTTLIKDGVLKNYLHSLDTASILKMKPTGNGRVENPSFMPIPRMSNTVLKQGGWSFDDLLKEVKNGVYVKGFSGGVVEPNSGQFSFAAQESYMIENGVIKKPLRGVTLGGSIIDNLSGIKVCNDFTNPNTAGTCGKGGQGVRVGDSSPHILLNEVIIGGSH